MAESEYAVIDMADAHAGPILDIFNHYVDSGLAAYSDQPLPPGWFGRLRELSAGYPAVTAVDGEGGVAGFAFLHAYHPAPVFRRTAEMTCFLHPDHTDRGLGGLMLARLAASALAMGVDTLVACISSLNPGGIEFHTRHGFAECGRLPAVGRMRSRDFDVVHMSKKLSPPAEPAETIVLSGGETFRRLSVGEVRLLRDILPALAHHHNRVAASFAGAYPTTPFENQFVKVARAVREGSSAVWGIFSGEEAVGFCKASHECEHGWIDWLYVDDRLRGRGYGAFMLEHMLDYLREKSVDLTDLMVVLGNDAKRFYRKHGFEVRTEVMGRRLRE